MNSRRTKATNKILPRFPMQLRDVSRLLVRCERLRCPMFRYVVRRFVPIAPALPNWTKNVPVIEKDNRIPDPRYQGQSHTFPAATSGTQLLPVDLLLNPCRCKNIWKCQCNRSSDSSDQERLETLVQVAASIASNHVSPTFQQSDALPSVQNPPSVRKSCCASKTVPPAVGSRENTELVRGPDLPPLLFDPDRMLFPSHDPSPFTIPTSIPSIESVALLAGTGCSCGFECACPGCVEHCVPPLQEGSDLRSCSDDCPHCVDRLEGTLLSEDEPPLRRSSFEGTIERLLARAVNLPPPPRNRSAGIDPTNVIVFPAGLFSVDFSSSSGSGKQEEARSAWGLVDIPKLECCAGACGCPDGRCTCGNSCAGCCVEGDTSSSSSESAEPLSCTNT